MIDISAYVIPILFLASFGYAIWKKVKVYDAFSEGAKGAFPLITTIFPYIATIMILSELFTASGLNEKVLTAISPLFEKLGIPKEIAPLLIMKPLSGNGSLAVISEILDKYGPDSYISRCACVAYGSSDTALYLSAVYFANLKRKNLGVAIFISIFAFFISVLAGCALCRWL